MACHEKCSHFKYRVKDHEEYLALCRARYASYGEKAREWARASSRKKRAENPEGIRKAMQIWRDKNRVSLRKYYVEYMREYNKKKDVVQKTRVRTAVNVALRNGRLVREGCKVCGGRAEAHHEDYSKPLDVTWLCRTHHAEAHKRIRS